MKEIKIKVKGMACEGCEKRIEGALKKITGIKKVKADHNQEIVTINTNKEIDINFIEEKITDLGYEIKKEK